MCIRDRSRTEEGRFVAKRAGQISEETQYVLGRFGMEAPGYVPNVGTRVKDMDIRRIAGVSHSISLKKAWNLMRNENVNTLPIVREDNILEGLITVSYTHLDVYKRQPDARLIEAADYVSEIKKIKHPYSQGQPARNGIEK